MSKEANYRKMNAFFKQLLKDPQLKPFFDPPPVLHPDENWICQNQGILRDGVPFCFTVLQKSAYVSLYLKLTRSDPLWEFLHNRKESIEAELGPLDWRYSQSPNLNSHIKGFGGYMTEETWPELHKRLSKLFLEFVQVLTPHVKDFFGH